MSSPFPFLWLGKKIVVCRFLCSQVLSIKIGSIIGFCSWKVDLVWAPYWEIDLHAPQCQPCGPFSTVRAAPATAAPAQFHSTSSCMVPERKGHCCHLCPSGHSTAGQKRISRQSSLPAMLSWWLWPYGPCHSWCWLHGHSWARRALTPASPHGETQGLGPFWHQEWVKARALVAPLEKEHVWGFYSS